MSKHRVPAQVQDCIQHAREADWKVSIRNEKVIITAPDEDEQGAPRPVNLTIGLNPNAESLKKFLREAAAYNLIEGPARTPAESARLLKEAEEKGRREAEEANRQRQEFDAQQAKKKAEAAQAAKKAAAATAQGLKTETAIPTQTTTANAGSVFPKFDKALMGTTDYSKFQLPDGRVYCIECWSEGIEFTARAPQGLATHRGFRHQMYQGTGTVHPVTTETSRVTLPDDVHDAIELLRSVVAENLSPVENTGRIAELEGLLNEVKQQAELDLKRSDANYEALKKSSDEALRAAKEKIHQLTQELTGRDGRQQAETESLMKSFQALLQQISDAVNNLAPVKAVAQVDELISPYLKATKS